MVLCKLLWELCQLSLMLTDSISPSSSVLTGTRSCQLSPKRMKGWWSPSIPLHMLLPEYCLGQISHQRLRPDPLPPPMLRADPYPWHPFLAAAVPWALLLSGTEQRAHLSSSAGVLTRGGRCSRSGSQKYTAEACWTAHLLPGLRAEAPHSFLHAAGCSGQEAWPVSRSVMLQPAHLLVRFDLQESFPCHSSLF